MKGNNRAGTGRTLAECCGQGKRRFVGRETKRRDFESQFWFTTLCLIAKRRRSELLARPKSCMMRYL